jgi:hypothetical protein
MTHTPGPWKIGPSYGVLQTEVVNEAGRAIATVWTHKPNPETRDVEPWPEGEANLNMATASPDLLEACKALVKATTISHSRIEQCPADLGEAECICGFHAALDIARAAIAKARGG